MSATEPPENLISRGGISHNSKGGSGLPSHAPSPYRFSNDNRKHPVTVPEGYDRAAKRLHDDLLWTAEPKGGGKAPLTGDCGHRPQGQQGRHR